jgi:hypothetical protein
LKYIIQTSLKNGTGFKPFSQELLAYAGRLALLFLLCYLYPLRKRKYILKVYILSLRRKCNAFYSKVNRLFVFGHFFCPFLKRGNTFGKKALQKMG